MSSQQESLQTLSEIKELMERSSKFLSLSGLSGVFAGIFALIGAGFAYARFKTDWLVEAMAPVITSHGNTKSEIISFLVLDGVLVLLASLSVAIFLTIKKAKKRGLNVWSNTSKRMLLAVLVPLTTGGIFCIAMLYYGFIWLVFPATLLFYGLALVSASRFTYPELFYLGLCEIVIGCIALFLTQFAIFFWAAGFGILHIIYGTAMYNRYDRKTSGTSPNSGLKTLAILLIISFSGVFIQSASAQYTLDTTAMSKTRKWYDKETIYLQGSNSYVKNDMIYSGQKAIKKEFMISPGGMELYLKSRRTRNIALVISVAGSVGSIVTLINGNRDALKKFFWVSLGTGITSTLITARANNLRDQAVWLRNRDAMIFIENGK